MNKTLWFQVLQGLVAFTAAAFFYSNMDLYGFETGLTTMTPKLWTWGFLAAASPLILVAFVRATKFEAPIPPALWLWAAWYLCLSGASFFLSHYPEVSYQIMKDRLFATVFLLSSVVVFRDSAGVATAKIAILLASLVTVGLNIYQYVYPTAFLLGTSMRSSGLYLNANQCAEALLIGMILSSPVVPRGLKLGFYLAIGVGVALTFSRSNLIAWVFAVACLTTLTSDLKKSGRRLAVGTVVGFIAIQSWIAVAPTIGEWLQLDNNTFDRLTFFNSWQAEDQASVERGYLMQRAWEMFTEHPIIGSGLGSTVSWSERTSTHNLLLAHMTDHGIIGATVFPLLLFALVGTSGRLTTAQIAYLVVVIWTAFFSHNILDQRYHLVAMAVLAAERQTQKATLPTRAPVHGRTSPAMRRSFQSA